MSIKVSWLTKTRIAQIERLYPSLKDQIELDDLGAGRKASGCYASNAAGKLQAHGEYKLADLLYRAVEETA